MNERRDELHSGVLWKRRLAAGFDAYLAKPVDAAELGVTVAGVRRDARI